MDYRYKRINHFSEWLDKLKPSKPKLGQKATDDLNKLIANINEHFNKNEYQMIHSNVHRYLRKKFQYKFYDNVNYILDRCNGPWIKKKYVDNAVLVLFAHSDENSLFYGIPYDLVKLVSQKSIEIRKCKIQPLHLSEEEETKLKQQFLEVEKIYDSIDKGTRKSFFSYNYLVHKLLELNDINHTVGIDSPITILRNSTKLLCQDKIWQKVCEKLGWKFISSFESVQIPFTKGYINHYP